MPGGMMEKLKKAMEAVGGRQWPLKIKMKSDMYVMGMGSDIKNQINPILIRKKKFENLTTIFKKGLVLNLKNNSYYIGGKLTMTGNLAMSAASFWEEVK
jgi:hypothetical protein